MNISVLGLGFVGKAMYDVFTELNCKVVGYDINTELSTHTFDECLNSEIMFLALPTPFNSQTKKYELGPIEQTCSRLQEQEFEGVVVLKSTLTPQSVEYLEDTFQSIQFIHNPEFLTARTAKEDFQNQTHIVLGKGKNCSQKQLQLVEEFYKTYFPNAEISLCNANESESMKIFANSFYALKIQFFTEIYLTCQKLNMNYDTVVSMMLKNGWINPMHTKVPGPDENISYGGYCFPKDTNALNEFMKQHNISNQVLEACIKERNEIREDNDNIL